jgi:hypothetical protein
MGSDASGGWKNYCMACKHMPIINLFLNNFIKWQIFLIIFTSRMRTSDAWILDNKETTLLGRHDI